MRFYKKELPDVDEVVMCQVQQIAEMGAYVKLLEYDGAEGMILLSELSRRRIRSIQKLIRVGRNEVVVVLRVDKEKGYIDLSKRRVSPEDVVKCEDQFTKSKAVHSIMAHVAGKLGREVEELYDSIVFPLHDKYGHAFDAFKLAILDMDKTFEGIQMDDEVRKELHANIARRMTPQPVKIRADVEVTCFGYEGIDAVKKALRAGEAVSSEAIPIKIKLVAPPLYVLITNSTDKVGGIALMEQALEKITESIRASGGDVNIKMKPKTVSEVEDQELEQLMARVEKENAEVEGDEDSEGDD
ncbi:translation initiation factor eIF-2 alpha subunit [Moesziomyces antarcticus]|uniref:Eukaryotic translation initiation factor 2 subunit alpha n=1 Tax=Pseudozyma antarctica TaxID=84753 RepID=A0A5C3FJP9_PSEA2|nr:translation initiation factor eIF-2 alpha subunit [Moesziomyces antarcticus]GAK63286.1 translation initiation factor eIF-2 alpha subunit [Moesziomyces antarcticus]SPO43867.1 probable SUI2 - translation initiation factor eIF-2 alpha chain [Moesziomyces antarcticus]